MEYDKTKFARAYWVLVQAGRRSEESIPDELKEEYNKIKEAESGA